MSSVSEEILIQREYPAAPLVGVGALIMDNGNILLARRGNPPAKGEWSVPGGLVHVGESLFDAVIREAVEETGLIVQPRYLVELIERIFRDEDGRVRYHYVIADYACTVLGGEPVAGSDADEIAWSNELALEEFHLPSITREVVQKALRMEAERLGRKTE
ncbi:NUDIX hydrolase [Desulfomonile tiedjei]|uniref:ADP-ribose pyrophosphatase n=1 Tax=Desulfomonile tiedjei (strain ATCC 49306 / DSM 6799 / DCB-1) TaxID=706587 RepID=I4C730_DESTA|nr:NUDIX hydrolase [Desulfomonile tiedjei]AFM25371.1 ADP-ribose pyrophosphatase [Desulfomonile tiedjei DSM 6799]